MEKLDVDALLKLNPQVDASAIRDHLEKQEKSLAKNSGTERPPARVKRPIGTEKQDWVSKVPRVRPNYRGI